MSVFGAWSLPAHVEGQPVVGCRPVSWQEYDYPSDVLEQLQAQVLDVAGEHLPVVPGSLTLRSHCCGVAVWLSPAGQDLLAHDGAYVACVVCTVRAMHPGDTVAVLRPNRGATS